jgi:endonuclease III
MISDPCKDQIVMTTTPPPPVVKSKSRFFGAQKSKPRENDEEQPVIEILSAPDERNVSPPQSPSNVAEETAIAPAEATTKQNEVNLRLETEDSPKDDSSSNIFAKFAFGAAAAGSKSTGIINEQSPVVKKWTTITATSTKEQNLKKRKRPAQEEKCKDWIRMVDCSKDEQERIVQKWHSLADSSAPLETRRFQVLVAARLHARCQEPVVRKCMDALRQEYAPLDAATLSRADPEKLAITLSSLQYYNVKAKHCVTAANQVQTQFQGIVPEQESELLKITGIGPVLADVLAFVNTIEAHTQK